jgi:hypothetical protein
MTSMNNAQEILNQFDDFFDQLTQDSSINIVLDVEVSDRPGLEIKINSDTLYNSQLDPGSHTITLEYPNHQKIDLEISMYGKSSRDTVIENNQIIKDKFIMIKGLTINNFDLFNDADLFYNKFIYLNEKQQQEQVKPGFWNNCTLKLQFSIPIVSWINQNSTKNFSVAQPLRNPNALLVEETFNDLVKNVQLLK